MKTPAGYNESMYLNNNNNRFNDKNCHKIFILAAHEDTSLPKESQFRILQKCKEKFECLVNEMLFIKEHNQFKHTN